MDPSAQIMTTIMMLGRSDIPFILNLIIILFMNKEILTNIYKLFTSIHKKFRKKNRVSYVLHEYNMIKDGKVQHYMGSDTTFGMITSEVLESIREGDDYLVECISSSVMGYLFPYVNNLIVAPGIYVTTNKNVTNAMEKNSDQLVTFTITLFSDELSFQKLSEFVTEIERKYRDKVKKLLDSGGTCVYSIGTTKQKSVITNHATRGSSKTFNSIFFAEKSLLLTKLDHFMHKKDVYTKLGIPHTLGIMLYGEPGTGKTSCIKAIANYTKRHIVQVQTKYITTSNRLADLFAVYNAQTHVFVFEEIDCGTWKDIVSSRELKKEPVESDMKKLVKECIEEEKVDVESKLTLAELLERIDGIHEDHGRIIIFTTNHPETIDPALLRPGRMDLCIEMKKMRRVDIAEMYKLWFDESISPEVLKNVLDYKFTQADVGYMFSTYKGQDLIDRLVG